MLFRSDGYTLLDVVPTAEGLAVFGADEAEPGSLHVETFAGDGTPLTSEQARTGRYSAVSTARAAVADARFGVATYVSETNVFLTLDLEGRVDEVRALERAPVADARVASDGLGFAVVWGTAGDSPVLGLRGADGIQVGTAIDLLGGWAGVAADPVWTGKIWVALAGLGSRVDGSPGGAVLINGIGPAGVRTHWDTLVGDLESPVDDLALATDGDGSAAVWVSGGQVNAVAVDDALTAQGCIVSGEASGALVDVWYADGLVTAWLASGTEMWRWTADVSP